MTAINPATFQVNGAFTTTAIYGTVEVTLGLETRRVQAIRWLNSITAYGITGRYATGTKAWPGSIDLRDTGGEHVRFGFDSRSGKHRKTTISFAA